MLLRESGKKSDQDFDLNIVVGGKAKLGLEFEAEIIQLADAVCRGDESELLGVRERCVEVMGAQKTADVIMVVSGFNGITKIANGTGLHLDPDTEASTQEMRLETGIDHFSETAKAAKFD